jgi:hypothetical protein
MNDRHYIRIASGQGFWGDLPAAPIQQVRNGHIDYLMMDYLAEVTMSIMQKQKNRNPDLGYARDFVGVIDEIMPEISNGTVKVVSNAGGVNPLACAHAISLIAEQRGLKIRIAVVHKDDVLDSVSTLVQNGHTLDNMETGEPIESVQNKLLSANVYFGSRPIVDALKTGAQIVITGRVTDTGLCLGPLIHEFGWSFDDFDKMAAGTVAGHILECGAQSSGGNFTDWFTVDRFEDIGFPIVEAYQDGSFVVTKHENTGGLVHSMTVKEQLLYEIGDPQTYITPDCVADFTSIHLKDIGRNRVLVNGIKGKPATEFYKVSASYLEGYRLTGSLTYFWPEPLSKARVAFDILKKRSTNLGLKIDNFHADYIGFNGCDEKNAVNSGYEQPDEVQLRFSCSGHNKEHLDRLGMELAPLILTGPSGVTGFAGGRPKASEIVAYWPALLSKQAVEPAVQIIDTNN